MALAAKKKTGVKDRSSVEETATAASVQSMFTSAARATMWHADSSSTGANNAASVVTVPALSDAQRAHTAATNAVCGRPFGAIQLENSWSRAEGMRRVHKVENLLPRLPAWKPERAVYTRLFTASAPLASGSSTCSAAGTETNSEGSWAPPRTVETSYEEWLAYVAAHRSSPLLYPHHTLLFDAALMMSPRCTSAATSPSSAYVQVASVIHRLLAVYLERCRKQQSGIDAQSSERNVPSRTFASLLYTSVYNNNFSGPAEERKDVTFGSAELGNATVEKAADPSSHPPRRYDAMSVISCLSVAHLCVCVGKHYYKLNVIDDHYGRLRSVAAIAGGLEAICRHHMEVAQADPLSGASPVVRHDRDAMEMMFANLSSLSDKDAFDVRRRLQDASAVNVCSLDALQGGLCVLVLKDVDNSRGEDKEKAPVARWLHSVCSFEVSLRQPRQWLMRLLAVVAPSQAGLEWIARAATPPSVATAAATAAVHSAEPTPAEEEKPNDFAAGQLAAVQALRQAAFSTSVGEEGLAEYLELWLPEKHRIPLRPYPVPQWDPEATQLTVENISQAHGPTTEQFVMSLLRVIAEFKQSKTFLSSAPRNAREEWPCVVIAVQPLYGGAPTLVALDSPAIQHYYEVLAARPRLFAAATKKRIEAEAIEEVRAVLNIASYAVSTVRTPPPCSAGKSSSSSSWWDVLDKQPADLCVSFTVLPRAAPSSECTAVRRVVSNLALSSALLVNCTAQQTAAEAHQRASAARVIDAVVQANSKASVEFSRAFSSALASSAQS
ncbi:hypothetical protein ABL78_5537 [Leptomonas seymouri]|uniref:Choline/carnitine acyltransferase domain-containing protein n=1 Tax=Leptomonas seymouri TaxID=5684 RepID=A0A0N1PCI4_LEPSE|nr:hypothetical protein ABL78_5537 [Leptomonas seymouri]|eukprot:KPI85412.1 hypothetical protein ABL78_5537 [Leptomonas seymouri]